MHHRTNMELGAWMGPVPHKIAKAIIYFPVCARTNIKSCLFVSFPMATYMVTIMVLTLNRSPCSFGLSATSQQYFSLRINQPPTTSQQYFSLRTNQHQPSATSQTNRLVVIYNGCRY
jgi:hypothetical protein